MIRKFGILMIVLLAACGPVKRFRTPASVSDWPNVVKRASLAADSGNYANAERMLTAYAAQYPGTHEVHETLFWRALFKLDPSNVNGSVSEGIATLDKYMADTAATLYRPEATILKRLAITTQALQARVMTQPVRDTTIVRVSNDAEIASLKAELVRTNAELDRIKKRLANPNK